MERQIVRKILRLPEVIDLVGLSRSTIYKRISEGLFPLPISLGDRAIGFVSLEINEIIIAMINGTPKFKLKLLVAMMTEKRLALGVSYD
jgi:prophage regulatory protein